MSFEYALYEISFANLLLYSKTIPSYNTKKKDKKGNGDEIIRADDPRNRDLVKAVIGGYKF